jgi:glycosyltransferase involved in cell wall biosynthesis
MGANYGGEDLASTFCSQGFRPKSGPFSRDQVKQLVEASTLVHIHGIWDPNFHPFILQCRKSSCPYIIRTCGMLDPWSLSQKRVKKWLYRKFRLDAHLRNAAAIHFTTEAEAELAAKFCRSEQKIVEPNGVFIEEFPIESPVEFWNQFGIPQGSTVAIFLGRIHPKKGIDFLVRALKLNSRLELHLVIAGPNEENHQASLEKLAEGDPRIHFVGMLHGDRKKIALAAANFFVLTSFQENFGNAVVESLACGTPVMISPRVNLADVVADQKIGELVALNDEAIAKALWRWTSSPDLVSEYASRTRKVAEELYDWRQIAARWIGHYRRLSR